MAPIPARSTGELAKALLINTGTGEAHPVMFNPEEYKLETGNSFAEIGIPGLDTPPVQYVRGKARTLSMELFFDTYEAGRDVRDHTGEIVRLLDRDPRTEGPPVLVFSMGRFQFRCVLVDVGQRFTMFLRDGTPVRATLSVRFQEYARVEVEVQRGLFALSPTVSAAARQIGRTADRLLLGPGAGGGQGTVHVTAGGETLSGLAGAYLGDPGAWRRIAEANAIDDPFDLPPGRSLVIPIGGPG